VASKKVKKEKNWRSQRGGKKKTSLEGMEREFGKVGGEVARVCSKK